ncbi:hypothetical protein C922_02032 [Plasmodium inui San Antonio 1]|uniref:Plasmodium RESA N-terminal domain-containing protein n=1 Tax=Plasmodium inui San Antonio 1 TaxID=1237626 RepID=W7A999_9APIC|nr:hypothetical protein C922_02032 [Plasmodium inui San Antonio 1]EUD67843.1 hypothetical protein C922_02032 [Plasmodium inui San Antonio 1]
MKADVLAVLFSTVALAFVLRQSHAPHDMKNPADYSNHGRNAYPTQSVGSLGRILRSDNSNIFQQYSGSGGKVETNVMEGMTDVSALGTTLNIEIIQEDEDLYQEQLHELVDKITDTWNETFMNMVEDYIDFTERSNIIDGEWRCQMWNERWYRYLQYLVSSLNEVIENDNYPLEAKELISNEYLHWANHDFIWFLSIVKEEWDKREDLIESEPLGT